MKIIPHLLLTLMMGVGSTAAFAAECTSSFYCYGNTANTVVRVATRPPPIPPPNQRVVQQRRQAQIAMRNSTPITPRIARPAATPAPQRATTPAPPRVTPPQRVVVAAPVPQRAAPVPARAAPVVARPAPRAPVRVAPPAQPNRVVGNCQTFFSQASALESQAVVASKQNNRQRSVSLFKEAAKLRNKAAGMNCR